MTECNQPRFEFEEHFSLRVVAQFDGQRMSTAGGALLLRATDRKIANAAATIAILEANIISSRHFNFYSCALRPPAR
jgi:hypothetical protein